MAGWTPEEDATIRARARTHSAAQIAALLPGRSRASVTGRAWRLGESLAKDEATRRALEHPDRARGRRAVGPPRLAPDVADAWPSAPPAARRAARAVAPRLACLEAVAPGECRWPYGDDVVRFCAHPTFGSGPYCPAHRGLAYVPDGSAFDADALVAEIERRETRCGAVRTPMFGGENKS